jgi:predicted nucleic acid-binding protein
VARPPTAVVDASVAAKWFLPETGTEAARWLRDRHVNGEIRLVAPDLLAYEVANVLRYQPSMGSDQLVRLLEDLFALDLGLDSASETSMGAAASAAFRMGLSIYDSTYVALAERLDTVVYTADEEMLRAAGTRGQHLRTLRPSR